MFKANDARCEGAVGYGFSHRVTVAAHLLHAGWAFSGGLPESSPLPYHYNMAQSPHVNKPGCHIPHPSLSEVKVDCYLVIFLPSPE